nr:glycosyltransferase [Planococcus sp. ISL-110]
MQVSCGGLGRGGVQNVIMGICRNIDDIQFDILLFTDEERYYDQEFLELGGKIFRVPNYNGKSILRKRADYYIRFSRIFLNVYRILKKNGPYLAIHCHNSFESGICNLAAKLAGVKVRISHSHTAESATKFNVLRRFYDKILSELLNKYSNVKIGCSAEANNYLFEKQENSYVINNAIDLEQFNPLKFSEIKKNEIQFIHIGQYSSNKNQTFLIDIFDNMQKKISNVKLVLIGFGSEKEFLRSKIKSLNLETKVEMRNPSSDIPKSLFESDFFIFPSFKEGLGIVLLEAQAMGLKCFVSSTIPKEANLGLCTYIDLNLGAEEWASHILNHIAKRDFNKKILEPESLMAYDIKNICTKYVEIYTRKEMKNENWNFNIS